MNPAPAPWRVGSWACRIEMQMSDFYTWNALQEDTTGKPAYTNAAPYLVGHGKYGLIVKGVSQWVHHALWSDTSRKR